MRKLVDTGTKDIIKVDNLSPEFKFQMGQLLNSVEMLHIETLYFTVNGSFYYKAHEYKGNDKRYKGKKYARFRYENVDKSDPSGGVRRTRLSVPIDEFEIVEEIDAQIFVDEYVKMINEGYLAKTKKESKIDMNNTDVLEEYVKNLVYKIIKK